MPDNIEAPRARTDSDPHVATARRLAFIADEMVRGLEDPSHVPAFNVKALSPVILKFLAPIVANHRKRREAEKRKEQLRLPPPQLLLPAPTASPQPEPERPPAADGSDWERYVDQARRMIECGRTSVSQDEPLGLRLALERVAFNDRVMGEH